MARRMLFALLLLAAAHRADALEYTDIYYDPNESGWGANVIQNGTTQFITFFIYGQNGQPTWYVVATADDGTGAYTGTLYATTGTYFAAPWVGAQGTPVGTASFQPIDIYHATLTYSLTNGPTVTKTLQRQTLAPLPLAGNYSGSIGGKVTGCANAAANITVHARYNLAVTQVSNTSATLTFTFVDTTYNGMVCTLSGPLTQLGRLYQLQGGQYSCTGSGFSPGVVTATIDSFHSTGQGIEGRWTANTSGGCTESIRFAAVL